MFDINLENITEHYKDPQNFHLLKDGECHKEHNPLCGDEITFCLKVDGNKIVDASFTGTGCAISMASASMLTDKLKGMTIEELNQLGTDDIIELLGIEITAVRVKCAVLGLVAAKNALKRQKAVK